MQSFDKRMALDVIENALNDADTQFGRGVVTGLRGVFHPCGLLNVEEWEALLQRICIEFPGPGKSGMVGCRLS